MNNHKKQNNIRIEGLKNVDGNISSTPADDALQAWIAEAAYYKAEKRNFEPGLENQDWQEAENEILSNFGCSLIPEQKGQIYSGVGA